MVLIFRNVLRTLGRSLQFWAVEFFPAALHLLPFTANALQQYALRSRVNILTNQIEGCLPHLTLPQPSNE